MVSPIDVKSVLNFGWTALQFVYDRYQALSENDETRQRVHRRIKELQHSIGEMRKIGVGHIPLSCHDHIQKFKASLQTCQHTCNTLHARNAFQKFLDVSKHRKELLSIDRELKQAQSSLQLALSGVLMKQNRELKETVETTGARLEATTIHPSVGVYHGKGDRNKPRPFSIAKVNVRVCDDLMLVMWSDGKNTISQIIRYEVRYDDQKDFIVSADPQACKEGKGNEFSLRLGPPKVIPGQVYTFQVRAVNSQGPGEWSERKTIRFKIGQPNKPDKPTLAILSPTEVTVTANLLKQSDENGSPVHTCIVEYMPIDSNIAPTWKRQRNNVRRAQGRFAQGSVTYYCRDLAPDTTYRFRILMVNQVGESAPSNPEEVHTTQHIPGPPQNLRISSKRTDSMIKVRWDEPDMNSHAVFRYEVQVQQKAPNDWITFQSATHKAKSATLTGLKSNKKYLFRVRAINNKDQCGDFSDYVEGETRVGKAGRIAAATGAFFGGTVGGPLIGAAGLGMMAGESAHEKADSKAGKKAAATAAGVSAGVGGAILGTIGAPLFGASSAYLAYTGLQGELSEISPQSSDDEEAIPDLKKILKERK